VNVWFTRTDELSAARVAAARGVLSEDERARADRFRGAADRRDFTIAHSLLRHCLSKSGPLEPAAWRFETTRSGKPRLAGGASREFNLSHTRGLVACAIADPEIGIDLEVRDTRSSRYASVERSCAPAEREWLARSEGDEKALRFLELWTLKEALLKAMGGGLDRPFGSLAFDLGQSGSIALQGPPGGFASDWQLALYAPLPEARLAIAARAGHPLRFVVRRVVAETFAEDPLPLAPLRTSRPADRRSAG